MDSSFSSGRKAEQAVVLHLQKHGYKIIDQNWRTRFCEIDIVATKAKCLYFVEVKYRKSSQWGGGLDYITAKKLQQMHFAAQSYLAENPTRLQPVLAAIEVVGANYELGQLLPIVN